MLESLTNKVAGLKAGFIKKRIDEEANTDVFL